MSRNDPNQGIQGREGVQRQGPPTPPTRALPQRDGSWGQMPQAADTWLRLQCGARAPEDRARALGAGHPPEVFRTTGPRGKCPPRVEHQLPRLPPFSVFWNLPQVGARGRMGGEGRKGEGSGGHALCARGATRKARSRRSSHRQASKGNQRGTTASRSRSGAALPHAPPYPSLSAWACHLTWVAFPYRL